MKTLVEQKSDLRARVRLLAPLLVAVPALVILYLTFHFTSSQLRQWAEFNLKKTGQQIVEETKNFLNSADLSANYNAVWIAANQSSKTFAADFHKIARAQMDYFPYFQLIYFGDHGGNHWLNKKDPDGVLRTRLIERLDDSPTSREQLARAATLSEIHPEEKMVRQTLLSWIVRTSWYELGADGDLRFDYADRLKAYDPRLRPWYSGVEQKQGKSWIDVYTWENKFHDQIDYAAGITISYPVMRHGELAGVTGIDLVLEEISQFLGKIAISPNSRIFIFDSKGQLVGMPGQKVLLRAAPNQQKFERIRLSDIGDIAIADSYHALRQDILGESANAQANKLGPFAEKILRFTSQNISVLGFFRPLDPIFNLDWYVGVLMPESDVNGDLEQRFRWAFVGVIAVV
ncbi:MAG: cache domain-containing protein, partial [Magnetococcales bacterium]|nr:cache domain-containing protein [Magnetococcales bacterium]